MKTGIGQITDFEMKVGSGIALLTLKEKGKSKLIYCEAAPTMRALSDAFGNNFIGQWIEYSLDILGVLKSFRCMEDEA